MNHSLSYLKQYYDNLSQRLWKHFGGSEGFIPPLPPTGTEQGLLPVPQSLLNVLLVDDIYMNFFLDTNYLKGDERLFMVK